MFAIIIICIQLHVCRKFHEKYTSAYLTSLFNQVTSIIRPSYVSNLGGHFNGKIKVDGIWEITHDYLIQQKEQHFYWLRMDISKKLDTW